MKDRSFTVANQVAVFVTTKHHRVSETYKSERGNTQTHSYHQSAEWGKLQLRKNTVQHKTVTDLLLCTFTCIWAIVKILSPISLSLSLSHSLMHKHTHLSVSILSQELHTQQFTLFSTTLVKRTTTHYEHIFLGRKRVLTLTNFSNNSGNIGL